MTAPSISNTWTCERDEAFFRLVLGLFPAAFLEAAGVLLASYDDVPLLAALGD